MALQASDSRVDLSVHEEVGSSNSTSKSETPLTSNIVATPSSTLAPALSSLATLSTPIAAIAGPLSITNNKEVRTFSDLPTEIQAAIWEVAADEPRLVCWRPGGGKPPAILSVNNQAREIARKRYFICFTTLLRNQSYSVFINLEVDLVYRKNMLPNMVRIQTLPPIMAPITMEVAKPVGPGWNVPYWIRPLKRLALNLQEVVAPPRAPRNPALRHPARTSHPRIQDVWSKLKIMCPDLEELVVIVLGAGEQVNNLEDLEVVPPGWGTNEQLQMMAQVRVGLAIVQAGGKLENLAVRFMRVAQSTTGR